MPMRRSTLLAVVVAVVAAALAANVASGSSVLQRARFLRAALQPVDGAEARFAEAGGAAALGCPDDSGSCGDSDASASGSDGGSDCSEEERSSTCCTPASGECCSNDSASCDDGESSEESSDEDDADDSEESSEESSSGGDDDDDDDESSEESSEAAGCSACARKCKGKTGEKKDACYKQTLRQQARDRANPALDQLTVVPVQVPAAAKLHSDYMDAIVRRKEWRRDCDINKAEGKPCEPMKYEDKKEEKEAALFLELPACAGLERFAECSTESCLNQASACQRARAAARNAPVVPRTVPAGSLAPAQPKLVPATVAAAGSSSGPCPDHVKASTCCAHAAQTCCNNPCAGAPPVQTPTTPCGGQKDCSDIQVQ